MFKKTMLLGLLSMSILSGCQTIRPITQRQLSQPNRVTIQAKQTKLSELASQELTKLLKHPDEQSQLDQSEEFLRKYPDTKSILARSGWTASAFSESRKLQFKALKKSLQYLSRREEDDHQTAAQMMMEISDKPRSLREINRASYQVLRYLADFCKRPSTQLELKKTLRHADYAPNQTKTYEALRHGFRVVQRSF